MRKLWTIRWFRVLLGVVLTAALLAPVVLPALQMQRQEPENPIRKENIQPVRRLELWRRETAARLPPRRLRRKPEQAAASPGRSRILNSRRRSRPARTCPSSCLSSPDPTRSRSPARNPASSRREDRRPAGRRRRRDAARRTRPWPRTHLVPLRRGALSLTLPVGYDRAAGCAYCAAARWKAAL